MVFKQIIVLQRQSQISVNKKNANNFMNFQEYTERNVLLC